MTGVDLPTLVGPYGWHWILAFLFVAFLSWPANALVGFLFRRQMRKCAVRVATAKYAGRDATLQEIETEYNAIFNHFDLVTAARVGVMERIIYAFAIMFGNAFALISGWIVLKAFNSWLEGFEIRQKSEDTALALLGAAQIGPDEIRAQIEAIKSGSRGTSVSRMVYYHLYLLGNGLSLMTGIALGFIGLELAAHWPTFVGWICPA